MANPIRSSLLKLVAALWFALAVCPVRADPPQISQPQSLDLTLLHDNDLHGHLLPFAFTEVGRSLPGKVPSETPSVGGAARRATLIRALKAKIKNPVLVTDSGDIFTRGPLWTTYEGMADAEAMNAVGYDLACLGNNEFKDKQGVDADDAQGAQSDLLQFAKRLRVPLLCANVTEPNGAILEGMEPYVVRQINGVRVGFLGLVTYGIAKYPQTKGLIVTKPIESAEAWIPEARKHCDILIALTHLGVDDDQKLAAQTTGLDAIVGGHSHTFLYKALEVKNPDGVTVPIVQDGAFGVNLGRFDLHFAKDAAGTWHLKTYEETLIPVDDKIAEAPDVAAILAPYAQPMLTPIGHLDKIGATPDERLKMTAQVVADAARRATNADLGIEMPGSGLYNELFEVFRHQTVTRYDVYAVLPFHDNIALVTLTGKALRALLSSGLTMAVSGDASALKDDRVYKIACEDDQAASLNGVASTAIQPTTLDIREAVIADLGEMGRAH